MGGAAVGLLPVHDAARCQHEPPAEAGSMQRPQQDGGGEGVVAHVVGHVVERRPEADHRCLVRHGVHADQRGGHRLGVTHVRPHPAGRRVQVLWRCPVCGGVE